jgi:hypothetical protein
MAKSIENRVKDSFPPTDKDSLKYYLDALMVTWKDHANRIQRSATLMLVLVLAFELLSRGAIKQVTIGGLVLSHTSTIAAFLPTGVMYLIYETIDCSVSFEIISTAYTATLALWNEAAERNDLDIILQPRTPAYFSAGTEGREDISGTTKAANRIQICILVVVLFGSLGFEVYAFYQLFDVLHAGSILLWLNVAVSVLFLSAGLTLGFTWASESS